MFDLYLSMGRDFDTNLSICQLINITFQRSHSGRTAAVNTPLPRAFVSVIYRDMVYMQYTKAVTQTATTV